MLLSFRTLCCHKKIKVLQLECEHLCYVNKSSDSMVNKIENPEICNLTKTKEETTVKLYLSTNLRVTHTHTHISHTH